MLKLEQMFPQKAKFKLSTTGKEYSLRAITVSDNIWIKQKYGDRLEEIFSTIDVEAISEIVYQLIVNKSDFVKQEYKDVDEEGNESIMEIGGCKLFQKLIVNQKDLANVIWALNETMGISQPIVEDDKKKVSKTYKKKTKKKVVKKKVKKKSK